MNLLPVEVVEERLRLLDGWQMEGSSIARDYSFTSFRQAMAFVNEVAVKAEAVNHHPDIDIRYSRVRLSLISHDVGGLTRRDFDLAASINAIDQESRE